MKEEISDRDLERLSISELMVTHMLGGLNREQVDLAKLLVQEQIEAGEEHLQELALAFSNRFLHNSFPPTMEFSNLFDYLAWIWQERPASIDEALNKDAVHLWQRSMLDIYRTLDSKINGSQQQGGFIRELKRDTQYMEVAYSSSRGRRASLMIVRRKNVGRAVEKISYRLLKKEIEERIAQRRGMPKSAFKKVVIDDWFGIKLVTYAESQVQPQLFEPLYPYLEAYGLEPDPHREPCWTREGKPALREIKGGSRRRNIRLYQPSGVDNHYLYGQQPAKIVQVKVKRKDDPSHRIREIDLVDTTNFLAGEMDHVRFRQSQRNAIYDLISKRRSYRERYQDFLSRGIELTEHLPLLPRR